MSNTASLVAVDGSQVYLLLILSAEKTAVVVSTETRRGGNGKIVNIHETMSCVERRSSIYIFSCSFLDTLRTVVIPETKLIEGALQPHLEPLAAAAEFNLTTCV